MINMEKYKQLRESFLKISELHIDNITLNELKLKYKYCINSNRTMGYIKDLEFLIRVLEKRTILRYNNIEPLKYISTQYVKDPALDLILSKYDTEIKTMEYSPFYKSCSQQSVTMVESRLPQSTALPTYDPVELQTQYDPVPITGSSFNKKEQIQRKVFLRISEELGRFWRDLARHLNIRESEIDAIESQTNLDLKNKAYEALKIFASRSDDDSWKSDLLRALDNSRRKDIREMVEKHLLFQDK
ncbi:fas-associated death domain protein isoform X3 [Cephus cinctus]|uniref:Fas-associated death domain protein isoform X3 n=1 Tax=Cephus cinctus TaxID=211228 RepID=A0AAJ7CAD8_CEPCN|nr:fas-associated death domain protein isoform X3 [Cephus cinctus]